MRDHGNVKGALVNCEMCGNYFWGSFRNKFCSDECKTGAAGVRHEKWSQENEEHIAEYRKSYYTEHKDRIRGRVREYRLRNPEKVRENNRKWRENNPEKYAEYYARSNEKLKDKIKERNIITYWENRDEVRKSLEEYARNNPDAVRMNKKRYKLRRKEWEGRTDYTITQRALNRLMVIYRWSCAHCGDRLGDTYQWDHVIPLSRGGSHSEGNLVPSCRDCNYTKRNLFLTEWKKRDRIRRVGTYTGPQPKENEG